MWKNKVSFTKNLPRLRLKAPAINQARTKKVLACQSIQPIPRQPQSKIKAKEWLELFVRLEVVLAVLASKIVIIIEVSTFFQTDQDLEESTTKVWPELIVSRLTAF